MIAFNFKTQQPLPKKPFVKYPYILEIEGEFTIKINKRVFFHDLNFSIFEFLKFADQWLEEQSADMLYISIDTNENPLISFRKNIHGCKIYSPWQLFECNKIFSRDELEKAILDLKESLGYINCTN